MVGHSMGSMVDCGGEVSGVDKGSDTMGVFMVDRSLLVDRLHMAQFQVGQCGFRWDSVVASVSIFLLCICLSLSR